MSSAVSRVSAASPEEALKYFSSLLALETDCWDVNHAINNDRQDFVLLDVRGEESYAAGHLPQAINLPNWKVKKENLSKYDKDTLFVVYCAGPHCNGADKAALHLALMGRPVKKMIGGVTGWIDEGFELIQ
ncbi:MAG TPA: rhodanese-like domain-containing protein [Leucothrix mucor]|nr:rhodanese-like domain-containing protein [Leucothrix mucor]